MQVWLDKAERHNTSLNINQKLNRLEELNLSMARALYWPKIVVTSSVGYGESKNQFFNQTNERSGTNYSVGISARYPLFAGFKNVTALRNLKLGNKNQELTLKQYQNELESLVHLQWAVLQNTYQQVIFELDAVELAKENLSLSQRQLNLGNIEGVAFREAQLSLIKSLTRLATSKFEARLALVELERLAGQIQVE